LETSAQLKFASPLRQNFPNTAGFGISLPKVDMQSKYSSCLPIVKVFNPPPVSQLN